MGRYKSVGQELELERELHLEPVLELPGLRGRQRAHKSELESELPQELESGLLPELPTALQ
jgi:hypothetical protein